MVGLKKAQMMSQSSDVARKALIDAVLADCAFLSLFKTAGKNRWHGMKVGRVQRKIPCYSGQVVGRRMGRAVDISIELLPIEADIAANLRNGFFLAAGIAKIFNEVTGFHV